MDPLTHGDMHAMWFGSTEPDEVKLARIALAIAERGFGDTPESVRTELDGLVAFWHEHGHM